MPLTPQDVRDKMFTSVRFKQGYDEDEVDAFLDRVEAELTRLLSENERLAGELARARAAGAEPVADGAEAEQPGGPPAGSDAGEPAGDVPGEASGGAVAAAEVPVGATTSMAPWAPRPSTELGRSTGAAPPFLDDSPLPPPSPTEDALRRTLVLAQRTADAAIAEARAEAAAIMEDATSKAAEIERVTRLEQATREHDHRVEFERLQSAVEQLRGFEREYRGRLKAYLHLQMRELEDSTPVEPTAVGGLPSRSALGAGASMAEGGENAGFLADPDFGDESGHFSNVQADGQPEGQREGSAADPRQHSAHGEPFGSDSAR